MKSRCLLLALIALVGIAQGGSLQLGSGSQRNSVSGSAGSFAPVFSADGRYVVFMSLARNLVTNDDVSPLLQVYRRDLTLGVTELVSVNTNGTGGANEGASSPSISADGRLIAFESAADNLVANDTNGVSDIFLRDMVSGMTTLASVSTNGLRSGNRASAAPQLTPDGRYVAFGSDATDLVSGDTNELNDVFIRDLAAGQTVRVSLQPIPVAGFVRSVTPVISISDDARLAAFETSVPNTPSNIVIWKRAGNVTILASQNVTNYFPTVGVRSFNPNLDAAGRKVAFFAGPLANPSADSLFVFDVDSNILTSVAATVRSDDPPPLSTGGQWTAYVQSNALYLHDLVQGTNLQICGPSGLTNLIPRSAPLLNANASRLLFSASISSSDLPVLLSYEPASGLFKTFSVSTNGAPTTTEVGSLPSMSDDASRIAYVSAAANIVAADYNQESDVFWINTTTGQTQLVSKRASGRTHSASHRIASYDTPAMSANGRFLAFVSLDNELVPGDDNPGADVFVRDLQSNTLERLVPTNRVSSSVTCLRPAISADGRHVAWLEHPRPLFGDDQSLGQPVTNIVWLDRQTGESRHVQATSSGFRYPFHNPPVLSRDGRTLVFTLNQQVYLRRMDVPGATNQLISANLAGAPGAAESGNPQITPDGQWVVFSSVAASMATNALTQTYGIYARNLAGGWTKFISRPPPDKPTTGIDLKYQVCEDSRHVVFSTPRGGGSVSERRAFLVDLLSTNVPIAVCSNCINPSASVDGRFVTFDQQKAEFFNYAYFVYVRDMVTGLAEDISQNFDGSASTNVLPTLPVISGDGRFVAFRNGNSRLVAHDRNTELDVFVRDRLLAFTFSLTRRSSPRTYFYSPGTFGFGPDGVTLLLSSLLPGLTENDFSPSADVFLLHVEAVDSDGDGLDDQWELAFFDTLARDGSGDYDGDGASDKAEFLAGTDPTNAGSTLPILAISALSSSSRTIFWNAIPGRSYRVEFKDTVAVPGWTPIGAAVTAASLTASLVDSTIGTNSLRFYRVRILP